MEELDGVELRFLSLGDFGGGCIGANASAADMRELSSDVFSLTERRNDSSTCCYHFVWEALDSDDTNE